MTRLVCPVCNRPATASLAPTGQTVINHHRRRTLAGGWAWCPGSDRPVEEPRA